MSNKKDKILELLNITNRINNNESGLDTQYNILLQEINELFIFNSPLLTIFFDQRILAKQNKDLFGHKDTKYKDSNGIYQYEVQSTALINSSYEFTSNILNNITNIYFTNKSVIEAMIYFKSKGYVVNVLNFANSYVCCGHVEKRAIAQEEELCRSSPMLYNSLQLFSGTEKSESDYVYDEKFGWGYNWNQRILITPNVIFRRKDKKYNYEKLEKPFMSNVISAAAPNLSGQTFNKDDKKLEEKLQRVIKHIYYATDNSFDNITTQQINVEIIWRGFNGTEITDTKPNKNIFPIKERKRVLLLGPWGCGIFAPSNGSIYYEFMAEQFCKVLEKVDKIYDIVCFTFLKIDDEIYTKFYEVISKKFIIIKEDYV